MSDAVMTRENSIDSLEPAFLREEHGRYKVGVGCFLVSEVAFFGTLIVAYVTYMGAPIVGPTPKEALGFVSPLFGTFCLVASSFTAQIASAAFARGNSGRFGVLWGATIGLGILFLVLTLLEWRDLIERHGLTIDRNTFGTTYYTLVGFHAFHVTMGVVAMLIALEMAFRRGGAVIRPIAVELVSWYWHFVDVVWIIVFFIVYVLSRSR